MKKTFDGKKCIEKCIIWLNDFDTKHVLKVEVIIIEEFKPSVYNKPSNPLFSDEARARYRRVGYDEKRM